MAFINERLFLKWVDFQQNISTTFRELRGGIDFSDITLVGDDGQEIEAHRIILSASSVFFLNVLKSNKHSHPMIFMRGLKCKDLQALLDFMYHGKANIDQNDLNNFLLLAKELQVKGLSEDNLQEGQYEEHKSEKFKKRSLPKSETKLNVTNDIVQIKEDTINKELNTTPKEHKTNTTVTDFSTSVVTVEDIGDLDEKIRSMMQKVEKRGWECSFCGQTKKDKGHIVQHIEAKHIDASHLCNQCDKVSPSRQALTKHISRHHKTF